MENNCIEKKVYGYPWQIKILKYVISFMLLLMIVLAVYNVLLLWPKNVEEMLHLGKVLFGLLVSFLMAVFVRIIYSDITVAAEGIWVEYFFKDLYVPWCDTDRVYKAPWRFPRMWFIRTKGKHLPFVFQLPSLLYIHSFRRHIPIVGFIKNEKELISIIRKNMSKHIMEP